MNDVNILKIKWEDKQGIYHRSKNEFHKILSVRFYESLKGKKVVFLDLNYWINFREAKPLYTAIYGKLKILVETGQIICVLSSSIIDEMGKMQMDKRLATARMMDSLQCKTVLNNIHICAHELRNLDYALSGKALMKDYQFSPVFESNPFLSDAVLRKHQAEEDFVYNLLYEDLFEMSIEQYCKETDSRHFDSSDRFARGFNQAKKHTMQIQSYVQELAEGLQSQIVACAELTGYTFTSRPDVMNSLPLFIQHAPYMYVLSAVNAAVAVDRDRIFKQNDFFDSQHSCAAIGYTDFFFTERKFHHLLYAKPIDISSHFSTQVGSDPEEVLNQLNEIV